MSYNDKNSSSYNSSYPQDQYGQQGYNNGYQDPYAQYPATGGYPATGAYPATGGYPSTGGYPAGMPGAYPPTGGYPPMGGMGGCPPMAGGRPPMSPQAKQAAKHLIQQIAAGRAQQGAYPGGAGYPAGGYPAGGAYPQSGAGGYPPMY